MASGSDPECFQGGASAVWKSFSIVPANGRSLAGVGRPDIIERSQLSQYSVSWRQSQMTQKVKSALLGGAAVVAVIGIYLAVSTRSRPQRLDVMAMVKPDTEFRIVRRRPENNYWDDGSPFDRTAALAVLNAMAGATEWDGKHHAAAYGVHASFSGLDARLSVVQGHGGQNATR